MTGRVPEHAEVAIAGRLMLVPDGAELQDAGLRGVDVADGEIQMELLRMCAAGPGRRHPVIDALNASAARPSGLSGLTPPPGGARVAQSRFDPSIPARHRNRTGPAGLRRDSRSRSDPAAGRGRWWDPAMHRSCRHHRWRRRSRRQPKPAWCSAADVTLQGWRPRSNWGITPRERCRAGIRDRGDAAVIDGMHRVARRRHRRRPDP